jgi:hypothetical protein
MAQYIAVRALNRSSNVRIINSDGDKVKLTTTSDEVVDVSDPKQLRELARHSYVGQWIVTASNDSSGVVSLPANS